MQESKPQETTLIPYLLSGADFQKWEKINRILNKDNKMYNFNSQNIEPIFK